MRNWASDDDCLDVQAVNLTAGVALMTDGSTRLIDSMFDADGEDTDDPVAAMSAVIMDREDSWFAIDLLAFS